MESFYHLLPHLKYGRSNAMKSEEILKSVLNTDSGKRTTNFDRRLRSLCHEARMNGHRVIGDEAGYYIAATFEEWETYKQRRLNAFGQELQALSAVEKISVKDLIKNFYHVTVSDNNYELNF